MKKLQLTHGVRGAVRAVMSHQGLQALVLALAIVVPWSASAQAMTLPGMNLTQHCQTLYGSTAFSYLQQPNPTAFSWKCWHQSQAKSMDLNRACRDQYKHYVNGVEIDEGYEAAYQNYSDPYSWYCVLRNPYATAQVPSYKPELYLWKGRNIALRTPDRTTCTTPQIQHIVTGIDKGVDFYAEVTGDDPPQHLHYDELNSLAVLPSGAALPCVGVACGYRGFTGVEFKFEVFRDQMCPDAAAGVHDSTPYYELGRNYWFYETKLSSNESNYGHSIRTGYAVAMRFLAMSYEGLSGNSAHNTLYTQILGLVDTYRTTTVACGTSGATTTPTTPGGSTCYRYDWSNTLRANSGLAGRNSTDLFASIIFRLHRQHGWNFINNVWKEAATLSNVTSPFHAADNFVFAASRAAGVNLADVFQNSWRWPLSSSARTQLQSELGSPVSVTPYH
ncbi:calcium-binding protein [Myxococcus sp. SDU36]|uniref:calcium-binding protein n=1 Tax=Myxococcus sp. SDU36 TaxID=2831967 RepID=UPI002543E29F|nr:calcium-binding protein [Myxococcus sp. SDU36]